MHPSTNLPTNPSICMSPSVSKQIYIQSSIYRPIQPHIYLPNYLSIHLHVYLFTHIPYSSTHPSVHTLIGTCVPVPAMRIHNYQCFPHQPLSGLVISFYLFFDQFSEVRGTLVFGHILEEPSDFSETQEDHISVSQQSSIDQGNKQEPHNSEKGTANGNMSNATNSKKESTGQS